MYYYTTTFCERGLRELLKMMRQIFVVFIAGFIMYFFSVTEFSWSMLPNCNDIKSITVEDVFLFAQKGLSSAKKQLPDAASAMAHMAVTGDEFGQPIDECPSQTITPVFSVQGGTVIETGTSDEMGNYIVISHAREAKSVYGNCSNVYVQKLERVKKGQVIGEFNTDAEKEFTYSLIMNEPEQE